MSIMDADDVLYLVTAVREARGKVKDDVLRRTSEKGLTLKVPKRESEKAFLLLYHGYDGSSRQGLQCRVTRRGNMVFEVDDQTPAIIKAYNRIAESGKYPNPKLQLKYKVVKPKLRR